MHISMELLQRYNRPGPRYTSYPTAIEFHENVAAQDYTQALAESDKQSEIPWALYMHLPFCEERCLFCACHMIQTTHRNVASDYLKALFEEIDLVAAHIPNRRKVNQLHLGGGTPTYYSPEELTALMEHVRKTFTFEEGAELALEVDPTVTSHAHLEALAAQGFTRISLGVQDFDPIVQESIGRHQTFEQTGDLVKKAREVGFQSVNFDLIYGLPQQNTTRFRKTLEKVIELSPERLAVYSFAFVPWHKGNQKKLTEEDLPPAEEKLALLNLTREILTDAGYLAIGMDHFARPDDALASALKEGRLRRSFMGYTDQDAPESLGFGISAIGNLDRGFFQNEKKLSIYYQELSKQQLPIQRGVTLSTDDRIRRAVIQTLMCQFRIPKRDIAAEFSIDFDDYFRDELEELQQLEREEFLTLTPEQITLLPLGECFIRNVAMVFDQYRRQQQPKAKTFSQTV